MGACAARVKKVFLTRAQTENASLVFRLKRLASCCAHNLCAAGTQIPHLQDVTCFARRTRRQAKQIYILFRRARRNSTRFFDSSAAGIPVALPCLGRTGISVCCTIISVRTRAVIGCRIKNKASTEAVGITVKAGRKKKIAHEIPGSPLLPAGNSARYGGDGRRRFACATFFRC